MAGLVFLRTQMFQFYPWFLERKNKTIVIYESGSADVEHEMEPTALRDQSRLCFYEANIDTVMSKTK